MAEKTKIEWASHTFNPWIGCAKVRCGCTNCYAEAMAGRLGVVWGPNGTRRRTAESTWRQVEKWNRIAGLERPHKSDARYPSREFDRPRVFSSLCDPFEDWGGFVLDAKGRPLMHVINGDKPAPSRVVAEQWESQGCTRVTMPEVRQDFFALIDRCPNLDFLLLTKRPQNVRRMWPVATTYIPNIPPQGQDYRENCWLLYSASDQQSLESGLPHLLACRDLVPVIGLSLEPLIGPVDISAAVIKRRLGDPQPNWVIVGGESGPRARPCNVAWIRSIVSQCREAGVPCFVKQLGANIECIDVIDAADHFPGTVRLSEAKRPNARVHLRDPKGGDPSEWPEYLRVREIPRVC